MRGYLMGLAAVASVATLGCSTQQSGAFWEAGQQYEVRLAGSPKDGGVLRDSAGASDTLRVRVAVDSIRGDSLFGTYEGDFRRFRLMVGRASPGPQYVAGRVGDGSFALELTPDATDAGLLLAGIVSGGSASGEWHTEAHSNAGAFTVVRR